MAEWTQRKLTKLIANHFLLKKPQSPAEPKGFFSLEEQIMLQEGDAWIEAISSNSRVHIALFELFKDQPELS